MTRSIISKGFAIHISEAQYMRNARTKADRKQEQSAQREAFIEYLNRGGLDPFIEKINELIEEDYDGR